MEAELPKPPIVVLQSFALLLHCCLQPTVSGAPLCKCKMNGKEDIWVKPLNLDGIWASERE